MPDSLSDRLARAAHEEFVGRKPLCEEFLRVIRGEELPYLLLYLHGPGGVGKSSIIREFRYICGDQDIPCLSIDCSGTDGSADGIRNRISDALGGGSFERAVERLAGAEKRLVLTLDTVDRLDEAIDWMEKEFLPHLSSEVLVVVAGRRRPSGIFGGRPGWSTLARSVAVRNFNADEAREFVERSLIPESEYDRIIRATYGHPLALSLAATAAAQQPDAPLGVTDDQNIIRTLLDRLSMSVPSPAHRAAVEAAAMVRTLSEDLLARLLDVDDAHDLFRWLRDLSFIDTGAQGIAPHDLARDVLDRELRWRNPDWYEELNARARSWYRERFREVESAEQTSVLADYIYLYRHRRIVRPYYEQLNARRTQAPGVHMIRFDSERHRDGVLDMVREHEGEASQRIAAHWLDRQPESANVFVSGGELRGWMMGLRMDDVDEGDFEVDPGLRTAAGYLERQAPLREGERGLYFRYWMAKDGYQDVSPVQTMVFVETVRCYLTTPGLAHSFIVCREADSWEMIFAFADVPRIRDAEFDVDGTSFGVFGHDWRVRPPTEWLDVLASNDSTTVDRESDAESGPIVLSRDQFEEAVHDALGHFARPYRLEDNPLLRSSLVMNAGSDDDGNTDDDEADRRARLLELLEEAHDSLADAPRLAKAYQALDRTYFRPAPSQEKAAEALDMPYSTFRRHLGRGRDEIVEILWKQELA